MGQTWHVIRCWETQKHQPRIRYQLVYNTRNRNRRQVAISSRPRWHGATAAYKRIMSSANIKYNVFQIVDISTLSTECMWHFTHGLRNLHFQTAMSALDNAIHNLDKTSHDDILVHYHTYQDMVENISSGEKIENHSTFHKLFHEFSSFNFNCKMTMCQTFSNMVAKFFFGFLSPFN